MADSLEAAQKAVQRAEGELADASNKLDRAHDQLDQELAVVGWHRLEAVLSPGVRLYSSVASGATLNQAQVLQAIEQQRRAMAR